MKVVLTDEARGDLERIGDYIARDNPVRARSFIRELLGKAQGIGDAPEAFQLVPRYEQFKIRRRVHGNYAIFYRVEDARVTIIHILNGAQDYEALLFPEP